MSSRLVCLIAISLTLLGEAAFAQGQFLRSKESGVGFGFVQDRFEEHTASGGWMAFTFNGIADFSLQFSRGDQTTGMLGGSLFLRDVKENKNQTVFASLDAGIGAHDSYIVYGFGFSIYLNARIDRSVLAQLNASLSQFLARDSNWNTPTFGSAQLGQVGLTLFSKVGRIVPNLSIVLARNFDEGISSTLISFGLILGAHDQDMNQADNW